MRHVEEFTHHLNSIYQDIQFTTEKEENGSLAFLDTLTVKQQDGNVKVKVYRKPTHTDQYLNFESNQPLDHKLSMVRALNHRADCVASDPDYMRKEKKNINLRRHKGGGGGGGGREEEVNLTPPSIFLALNFCSLNDHQKLLHNCSLFVTTSFEPS